MRIRGIRPKTVEERLEALEKAVQKLERALQRPPARKGGRPTLHKVNDLVLAITGEIDDLKSRCREK